MLELRLFGYPRVIRDGLPVSFDTRKAAALLAFLAVSGLEQSRDVLAALLWPDLDRNRARAALRRTLSVAAAVGPQLVVTASAVRLDLARVRCDVCEFRTLAPTDDPVAWARAAALVEDGFLSGFVLRDSAVFDDWLFATAEGLRDELSSTLSRLVSHSAAAGDFADAVRYARQRTGIDALSEPAHADLIRALAWSGDRPGALGAYRALVRLLDRELGVPPLPETLALQDAIRRGTLPPPVARAAPVARPTAPGSAERIAPVMAGRDTELSELAAAWDTARRAGGTGRVVGVIGEAGMGKTMLVGAFADALAAGDTRTLLVTGHAAERLLPLTAAGDLMRAMLAARPTLTAELGSEVTSLAALASSLDPQGTAEIRNGGDLQRMHEAFRFALETMAHDDPVLVVVDDAHLLDASSAALLGYLARRPPAGLLLVATWARAAGDSPLPAAVLESGRALVLGSLDAAAVAQVLGVDGADDNRVAEVLSRTRGIPLLVQEYANAVPSLGTDSTASVREVVTARFDAAPELTRQVVASVAAIGTVSDPELLRTACGRDEAETVDAIEDALARGLLVEQTERPGYDVPHEFVRAVSLDALSLARKRLLNGRIADLLVRRHAVDPMATPAGAVARHLADAGRDAEAADWYMAAGAQSSRLSAHAEALEQYRRALALGHSALDVHEAIGGSLVRLGRYSDALVSLDQAAALAERDAPRLAAIEHTIAEIHDRLGDWTLARVHLESARDLTALGAHDRHARILADLALLEHRLGRADEAESTAVQAVREATEVGDDAALAQATNVLGVLAQTRGDHAEAAKLLVRAEQLARGVDDLDLRIAALNNLSRTASAAGDASQAMGAARSALELAGRQGDLHRLAALHSHLADLLHAAGDEDAAMAELTSSATAFAQVEGAEARPEVWTLTEW